MKEKDYRYGYSAFYRCTSFCRAVIQSGKVLEESGKTSCSFPEKAEMFFKNITDFSGKGCGIIGKTDHLSGEIYKSSGITPTLITKITYLRANIAYF